MLKKVSEYRNPTSILPETSIAKQNLPSILNCSSINLGWVLANALPGEVSAHEKLGK